MPNAYQNTDHLELKLAGSFRPNGKVHSTLQILVLIALLIYAFCETAIAAPPSIKRTDTDLIDITTAQSYYGTATTHTDGIAAWVSRPPEIKALAESLGAERLANSEITQAEFIENVYFYVRNNIELELRYGLGKGARGALLEQSGTPFDQAELMVEVLREGGVSVSYQLGSMSLTATQLGHWTGFGKNLTGDGFDENPYEAAQTFSVDRQGACKLLANGGIPGSVNGMTASGGVVDCETASGNLPTTGSVITIGHIWVKVGSDIYDPSYKLHRLISGDNLATMMGCSGGDCAGSSLNTAQSQVTIGDYVDAQSNPIATTYLNYLNTPARNTMEAALLAELKANGRSVSVTHVVGGYELVPSGKAIPQNLEPSYTASGSVITGEMPDQYRTVITILAPILPDWTTADNIFVFYADEISGKNLSFSGGQQSLSAGAAAFSLFIDGVATAGSSIGGSDAGSFVIETNHPFAAESGNFSDETAEFFLLESPQYPTGDFSTNPNVQNPDENSPWGSFPVTIVHGFGQTGPSLEKSITERMSAHGDGLLQNVQCFPSNSVGVIIYRSCNFESDAATSVRIRYLQSLVQTVASGVTKSHISNHHTMGIVFASRAGGMSHISVTSSAAMVGTDQNTTNTDDISLDVTAALFSAAEGAILGDPGARGARSAIGAFRVHDAEAVVEVSPSEMSAVLGTLPSISSLPLKYRSFEEERRMRMQEAANAGYTTLVPLKRLQSDYYDGAIQQFRDQYPGSLFFKDKERGYVVWEALKGGGAVSQPIDTVMSSTETEAIAAARRDDIASVSRSTGELSFNAAPDIIAGQGQFPKALPFQRIYSGGAIERVTHSTTYSCAGCGQSGPTQQNTERWKYQGADSTAFSHLGGGWDHNFNVTASYSGSVSKALGSDYAIEATFVIATAKLLNDLYADQDVVGKLNAIKLMSDYEVVRRMRDNLAVIKKGSSSETFFRLSDGTYNASGASSAKLELLDDSMQPYTRGWYYYDFAKYTFQNGDSFKFGLLYTGSEGDQIYFDNALRPELDVFGEYFLGYGFPTGQSAPVYKANYWTFPDGVRVDFEYDLELVFRGWVVCGGDLSYYSCHTDGQGAAEGYVLTKVSNNLGRELNFSRQLLDADRGYRITAVTDETGRTVSYSTSCDELICDAFTVTNPENEVIRYEYDADTDSPNPAVSLKSDYHLRRWFTPSDHANPYQTFVYDDMFRVKEIIDADGNPSQHLAGGIMGDENWKVSTSVSAAGLETTQIFDERNNLVQEINGLGDTMRHEYDGLNRRIRTIFPEGNQTSWVYDIRSNVIETRQIPEPSSSDPDIVMTTEYWEAANIYDCTNRARCNKPKKVNGPRTDVTDETDYVWNATTGLLESITQPVDGNGNRPQLTLSYQDFGAGGSQFKLLTSYTQKISTTETVTATYSYDAGNKFVLQSSAIDPTGLNLVTTYGINSYGWLTSINGPRTDVTDVTTFTYDNVGRILTATGADPDGAGALSPAVRENIYDTDGLLVRTCTKLGEGTAPVSCISATRAGQSYWALTDYAHDDIGRLRTQTDPEGEVTETTYLDDGRPNVVIDAEGRKTHTVYDVAGRPVKMIKAWAGNNDGTGATLDCAQMRSNTVTDPGQLQQCYQLYTYTVDGQIETIADANGNITTFAYDDYRRLASITFPDSTVESYGYLPSGEMSAKVTRDADTITFAYDALGRMTSRTVPSSNTGEATTFTHEYDLLNRKVMDSHGGIIQRYEYDKASRLTTKWHYKETAGGAGTMPVHYAYDQASNLRCMVYPDGYQLAYDTDTLGRPIRAFEPTGTYGQNFCQSYGASQSGDRSDVLATIDYDVISRRTSLTYGNGVSTSYDYTNRGDLTDLDLTFGSSQSASFDYTHNGVGQILSQTLTDTLPQVGGQSPLASPAAAFDESFGTTHYQVNNLNQYTDIGGNTPSYDANGNMTANGEGRTFTYNAENRLYAVNDNTVETAHYTYYADGNRRMKVINGASDTHHFYDGNQEIMETDVVNATTSGDTLRRFIRLPGSVDQAFLMIDFTGTGCAANGCKVYAQQNHLGSTIVTTDASGDVIETYAYTPHGGAANDNAGFPFRFTGQRLDAETGLYYYKARYYDPGMGRFLQTDPIGYADEMNLYGYVGNDPVNRIDALGLYDTCAEFRRDTGSTQSCVELAAIGQDFKTEDQAAAAVRDEIVKLTKEGADGSGKNAEWGFGIKETEDGQFRVTVAVSNGSGRQVETLALLEGTEKLEGTKRIAGSGHSHPDEVSFTRPVGTGRMASGDDPRVNRSRTSRFARKARVGTTPGDKFISFLYLPSGRIDKLIGELVQNPEDIFLTTGARNTVEQDTCYNTPTCYLP